MLSRGESGSVLALVPAGFLVLMILGALAVDSATAYLGQQQLRDALSAAANDAVTAGLANGSFYGGGRVALDPSATARTVCVAVATQADRDLHNVRLWVAIDGASLRLLGTATVDAVFGRVVPGVGTRTVRASASAVASSGPQPPAAQAVPSSFQPISCP
jgi:hypothetical protein